MAQNTKDSPGGIAPPPLICLGFLGFGFLIDYFLPVAGVPPLPRWLCFNRRRACPLHLGHLHVQPGIIHGVGEILTQTSYRL